MARAKKRSDGRYRVTLTVGTAPDGKPIRKEFYSRKSVTEAKALRDEYMRTHNYGGSGLPTPKYDGSITLDRWVETWLKTYKSSLALNTQDQYKQSAKRFCDFVFDGVRYGDRTIGSFLPMQISVYLNSMTGLSKASIRTAKMTISQIFEAAKKNGIISRDMTSDMIETVSAQRIRGTYVGHVSLTRENIDLINKHFSEHRLGLFVLTMIWTGCRPAECAALQWEDINFFRNEIFINKSLDLKHGGIVKETKTETGNRTIPIFAPLRAALLKCRKETGAVFTRPSGQTYTYETLSDAFDSFSGFMERLINGVPNAGHAQGFRKDKWIERNGNWKTFDYSLYDLRDTFCTTLYDAGVDLKTAQKLMGHKDASTTLKIYTKLSEQRETDSTDAMHDFIERTYCLNKQSMI